MELNTKEWKEFSVSEIFDLVSAKGDDSTELLIGKDIPYIAAKHNDNGFMMLCKLEEFENWVSKGECVVFVCLGEGSAGYTNYVPCDFIGMSGKIMCGYIKERFNQRMTPQIGCFLSTVLSLNRPKYSFGRSWTGDRLYNTKFKLPATKDGDPDWQYMETYINSLKWRDISKKSVNNKKIVIDITKWKEFQVKDIFAFKKLKKFAKIPEESGSVPFVSSTSDNNGITAYCNVPALKGNCITVSTNGDCFDPFYHSYPIAVSNDVEVLYNDNLNKYNAIFICSVLKCEKFKWAYGRKPKDGKVFATKIILPVKNNKPDWEYMETYIKSLPYSDKI